MSFISRILNRIAAPTGKRRIEAGAGGPRWQGAGMLHSPQ